MAESTSPAAPAVARKPEAAPAPAPANTAKTGAVARSPQADELHAIVHRAQTGDQSVLPELRKVLATQGIPALLGGELARRAEEVLVESLTKTSLLTREAVLARMAELRAELAGPNPSPVEQLLADRAVACWLNLHQLELIYAGRESTPLALAQHYQKSIDRAHRRYLTSLKVLADVRKIGITVQLNIARRQVNVAGGAGQPATAK